MAGRQSCFTFKQVGRQSWFHVEVLGARVSTQLWCALAFFSPGRGVALRGARVTEALSDTGQGGASGSEGHPTLLDPCVVSPLVCEAWWRYLCLVGYAVAHCMLRTQCRNYFVTGLSIGGNGHANKIVVSV